MSTITKLPADVGAWSEQRMQDELAARVERFDEIKDENSAGTRKEIEQLAGEMKRLNDAIEAGDFVQPHPGHYTPQGARASRKGSSSGYGRVEGLGAAFLKGMGKGRDGMKALDGTSGATLVPAFFDPRIRDLPQRALFVRSLIPTVAATGDKVNENLNPSVYTMDAMLDRLDRHGDLYEGVLKTKQRLGSALRALGS